MAESTQLAPHTEPQDGDNYPHDFDFDGACAQALADLLAQEGATDDPAMAISNELLPETPEDAVMNCFPPEERLLRRTVFIVDDEEGPRIGARTQIEVALMGFDVIEAPSAESAIVKLLRDGVAERIAFISTDFDMGRPDGGRALSGPEMAALLRGGAIKATGLREEFIDRLTKNPKGEGFVIPSRVREALRNVPIQLITAREPGELVDLLDRGIVDITLTKPVGISEMFRGIVQAAENLQTRTEVTQEEEPETEAA